MQIKGKLMNQTWENGLVLDLILTPLAQIWTVIFFLQKLSFLSQ